MMIASLLLALAAGCVTVPGDRITSGELAGAVPALAALPPSTLLGFSPVIGARRILTASTLNAMLEARGIADRVDADICVERSQRTLEREDLIAAMRKAFAPRAVEIEIVEFCRFGVPEGEIEFAVKDLVAPSSPRLPVRWRGLIRYEGSRRFDIWAMVRLKAERRRIVALAPLEAGQPILAGQVREEIDDAFPAVETTLADVVGRAPLRGIPAGAVVSRSLLSAPRAITRGATVNAEYNAGGVLLRVPMVAERSGQIGETIAVRNPASRKILQARVTAPGEVAVGEDSTRRTTR